jgi:hypothetical protein
MNLSMFNRFCPSLKDRVQLEERVGLNKFDRNKERYVIHMHRNNCWRGWGTFKRKRGLKLWCNCRRPGHLSKECLSTSPICLCCKIVGHEVEDCPRIISKVEKMNMR